jgi:hypothetical protein
MRLNEKEKRLALKGKKAAAVWSLWLRTGSARMLWMPERAVGSI